ncbi:DUF3883 domain-containing protein [Methanoculleus oceani]|uniref:Protein NO VEIN C-terminal domain-containing protein n=1 Tax=Methanoculleus oceani TaxID=2184756 RepID=A0ABD4TIB5_9EURY|nr:DUF3883 domain-containing protein [Methanoculleus sp. CWC-02]MCM2466684.1 hypothetical protein [Methanoculleus sp. CWC-02]
MRAQIPSNIQREHILRAITEIKEQGCPPHNKSTKYDLIYLGKRYPPKYVISLANEFANGELFNVSKFSGGEETNKRLRLLGFEIVEKEDDTRYPTNSYSWTVTSDNNALKRMDKSVFLHHGTVIPFEMRSFFGIEDLNAGEKRSVKLFFDGIAYFADIEMTKHDSSRSRLIWKTDFSSELRAAFPSIYDLFRHEEDKVTDAPCMQFERTAAQDEYIVSFDMAAQERQLEGKTRRADNSSLSQETDLPLWIFHQRFIQFQEAVKQKSGKEFVSFNEGLPSEWESYKQDIYEEGRSRLNFRNWVKEQIGTGHLLKCVIYAIEIDIKATKLRNNLVRWENRWGETARAQHSLYQALEDSKRCEAFESALFDFYRDIIAPESAFDAFANLMGRRYNLLAYLFFLKDREEYTPIAPQQLDKALTLLDVPLKTNRRCSWENYRSYNQVLKQVLKALEGEGLEDVSLLDAHSFCWMISHLVSDSQQEIPPAATVEPLIIDHSVEVLPPSMFSNDSDEELENGQSSGVDYGEKQRLNEYFGKLAEDEALRCEKERLRHAGREDLADAAKSVSNDPRLGYDIASFNEDGSKRYIEVKAVRPHKRFARFYLSSNELQKSRDLQPNYYYYFVFQVKTKPYVRCIEASELEERFLRPNQYSVTVPFKIHR